MSKAFRAFPEGIVAIFDEAAGGGEPTLLASNCNRPAADPESWMSSVYYHSLLNMLEVFSDDNVSISHSSIAVADTATGDASANATYDTNGSFINHDVKTHDLGYEPLVLVSIGTALLTPGYPVQVPAGTNGSVRYITPYVTTTKVFLHEFQSCGASVLPAQSITYRVIVFKQPPDPSGNKLFDFSPVTGIVKMAKGLFDSSRRYLQVVPGGSPLGIVTGRTMDLKNGAYRYARADGTTYDPIPDTVKQGIYAGGGGFAGDSDTLVYGAPMNYNGTFVGGTIAQVQAP